jgi:hypothetical protein
MSWVGSLSSVLFLVQSTSVGQASEQNSRLHVPDVVVDGGVVADNRGQARVPDVQTATPGQWQLREAVAVEARDGPAGLEKKQHQCLVLPTSPVV